MLLDLKPIEGLVAALKTGNLSRAEALTGIAKPSLSRLIARAEQDLGVQLLHREARKMVPTEAGKVLLAHCEAMLSEMQSRTKDVASEIDNVARGFSGRLSVVADNQFCTAFVSAVITSFAKRFRQAKIELDVAVGSETPDLSRIDCYICTAPPDGPDVVAKLLGRISYGFVASREYLAEHGTPRAAEELVQHRLIALRGSGELAQLPIRSPNGRTTASPQRLAITNNYWVMKNLCIDGLGIALLPEFFVRPEIEGGYLTAILPDCRTTPVGVYCAYRKQKVMSRMLQEFVNALVHDFQHLDRWNKYVPSRA